MAHVVLSHLLIQHVAVPINSSPRQPAILQFSFADRGIQGLNLHTHSVKDEENKLTKIRQATDTRKKYIHSDVSTNVSSSGGKYM